MMMMVVKIVKSVVVKDVTFRQMHPECTAE